MESGSSNSMVKLTSTNYSIWRPMMEDMLYCKDLYDPIESVTNTDGTVSKPSKPEKMEDREWLKLKRKALGTIRQWVDISIFNHVSQESDPYELWKKLEGLYERKTAHNKASLIKKLVHLKLKSGKSVSEHLSDFQDIINKLTTMKICLDDELQALFLLSSLPDSWETLVVTISNSAPDGVLSLDVIKESMFNEEIRRKEMGVDNTHALVVENRGRSKSRGPKGHNNSRSRSKSSDGKNANTCHYCKKPGHIKKYCFRMKREQRKKNDSQKEGDDKNTTAIASKSDDDVTLICAASECHHVDSSDSEWLVDTGASYHCVPRRDYFMTYQAGDFGSVKMGNQSSASIVGLGDIRVKTSVGCILTLKGVRHIPDLRLNLLSANVLDQEGFKHTFGDGKWKLSKGSMTVARGELCCSLYKTYLTVCSGELNAVEEKNSPNLWHRRLGHMSDKGLKCLAGKSLIPIDTAVALDPCDHCLAGKQHRASFARKSTKRQAKLELVHSDVCGPIEVESNGGSKYFVTFIDDATRKTWVYMLKTKSQVFETFQKFHAMVERETERKLKSLRSDNGGEYTSHEFKNYCSQHGIRHVKTVPGTPQHNGVVERMNRTIVEKVRCMLKMSDLPKSFWAEAVNTAVYLINRSPSIPLGLDIPERAWKGCDPTYSHPRVFGCKAYMHVPKDQRLKLDSKTTPCVFVGYGDEEYGFRLYDPEKQKVVRSRDVVFFEHEKGAELLGVRYHTYSDSFVDTTDVSSVPTSVSVEQPSYDDLDTPHDGVEDMQPDDDDDGDVPPFDDAPNDAQANNEEVHEQGEQNTPPDDDVLIRRSTRDRKPSTKYPSTDYILVTDEGEPESFQEVLTSEEKDLWLEAMKEEMDSLKKNNTYELVNLPRGKKVLKNRWVFKNKKDGEKIVKRKARLVVKGCNQKKGIDFDEIFSPVVKMTSIRTVLAVAASLDLELEQLDVKTAFLHGDLHEEIYMEQPEGFEEKGKEKLVCKLKKSLYGLKQAPRQWYRKFDSFMTSNGYKRTFADPCVYFRKFPGGNFIILLLYVDDMLIVGQDSVMIDNLKKDLSMSFDMKDLGPAKQILGMEIARDRKARKLWLSQEKYIERVLQRFNMKQAKPVSTPLASHFNLSKRACPTTEKEKASMSNIPYSSVVGSLMYAMVCTRPDIAHSVGLVSRYLSNPGKVHWDAVKWIFRYLRGTSKLCLCYGGGKLVLEGYTDADMAGDLDSRKSTSGYVFTLSGGAISWQSKLQKCVALSTTEAEYIAVVEASKEMLWLKRFLQELGLEQGEYVIFCDSQSALDLSKNSMYHARTKHIDVRYHWLRNVIEEKLMKLKKVHTNKNGADMLTKVVPGSKLDICGKLAGMSFKW
ncbi:unnamed protein product [Cuscuta epithymum]|uniref:Integrase catalytic domain-containing protein n=1 Tax=Cuscuta epithymum TaxID=186058 RepID=A0AAV0D228_9ASTE|nr:unnamed protein product [Cuscuta epithymum]